MTILNKGVEKNIQDKLSDIKRKRSVLIEKIVKKFEETTHVDDKESIKQWYYDEFLDLVIGFRDIDNRYEKLVDHLLSKDVERGKNEWLCEDNTVNAKIIQEKWKALQKIKEEGGYWMEWYGAEVDFVKTLAKYLVKYSPVTLVRHFKNDFAIV